MSKKIRYLLYIVTLLVILFIVYDNIPNIIANIIIKNHPNQEVYEIKTSNSDCIDYKKACLIAKSLKITKYYKIIITPYYIEFYEKGFLENSGGILKIIDPKMTKDDIYSMKEKLSNHEYFINDVGNGRYKRFTS